MDASAGIPSLPDGWRWETRAGVLVLLADLLDRAEAAHAFTTRVGGTSRAPFQTLNLGCAVGDAADAVHENRRKALEAIGRPLVDHVEAAQVHGAEAAVVRAQERGATIPRVDVLATRDPSVVLAMHCADCVPVLLADPVRRAVAAIHTGWRGTAAGAAPAAVHTMVSAFGSRPEDLVAAIGPAIGPCCYEVDAPVVAAFDRWPWRGDVMTPERHGRRRLDLWDANRRQLEDAGVCRERIAAVGLCTSCHPALFFSHRRDGRTGRTAGLIALGRP